MEIKTFRDGGLGFKGHQKAKGPERGGGMAEEWLHFGLGLTRDAFFCETHQSQACATCEFRDWMTKVTLRKTPEIFKMRVHEQLYANIFENISEIFLEKWISKTHSNLEYLNRLATIKDIYKNLPICQK